MRGSIGIQAMLPTLATGASLYSTYSFDPLHHLSGIAPYFESQDTDISPDLPQGCSVSKSAYLVRHAAIYANDFDFEEYIEPFIEKLQNKTNIKWASIPQLSFLRDWSPPISDAEVSLLTRVGRLEATQLGVDLNFRYPNLTVPKTIWTSSAERTNQSAHSLARGLEAEENSIHVKEIKEAKDSGADSLTPYKGCPKYSSSAGSKEAKKFVDIYTKPLMARFNDVAMEFNFTSNDILAMHQLCGYETVIRGSSPFCDLKLLTADDWLGWEYSEDIRYHYNVGYGNEAAGYVGLPWLSATADALEQKGNNSSSESILVSFTHRELPPMVLVAMGLFNNSEVSGAGHINETMPLDRVQHRRAWKTSNILPFLSNIAIEKLNCSSAYGYDDGEYYRVLVNSAVQGLPGCVDGPGFSCSSDGFVRYIEQRQNIFSDFSKGCGLKNNTASLLSIYQS